jgi:pimeloyl-ACP methyl ester carboxylesterase
MPSMLMWLAYVLWCAAAVLPLLRKAWYFYTAIPALVRTGEMLGSAVAGFARVVVPDMPGFGRADKPATFDYTVPGYARHLAGLREQLDVRRVHLVMHDFGGPWGMEWATADPKAVASVTLINAGAFLGYQWHWAARLWRTPLLGELTMDTATRWPFGLPLRNLPPAFLDRMWHDFDSGTRRAVLPLSRY